MVINSNIYVIRQWLITTTRKTHSVILTVHIAPKPGVYQKGTKEQRRVIDQ